MVRQDNKKSCWTFPKERPNSDESDHRYLGYRDGSPFVRHGLSAFVATRIRQKTYGASVGKSLRTRVGIQRISIRLKQMCLAVAADCRREEQIT